jgi:hypothetical protein
MITWYLKHYSNEAFNGFARNRFALKHFAKKTFTMAGIL